MAWFGRLLWLHGVIALCVRALHSPSFDDVAAAKDGLPQLAYAVTQIQGEKRAALNATHKKLRRGKQRGGANATHKQLKNGKQRIANEASHDGLQKTQQRHGANVAKSRLKQGKQGVSHTAAQKKLRHAKQGVAHNGTDPRAKHAKTDAPDATLQLLKEGQQSAAPNATRQLLQKRQQQTQQQQTQHHLEHKEDHKGAEQRQNKLKRLQHRQHQQPIYDNDAPVQAAEYPPAMERPAGQGYPPQPAVQHPPGAPGLPAPRGPNQFAPQPGGGLPGRQPGPLGGPKAKRSAAGGWEPLDFLDCLDPTSYVRTFFDKLEHGDLVGAAATAGKFSLLVLAFLLVVLFCVYVVFKSIRHPKSRKYVFSEEDNLAALQAMLPKLKGPITGDPCSDNVKQPHTKVLNFVASMGGGGDIEESKPSAMYLALVAAAPSSSEAGAAAAVPAAPSSTSRSSKDTGKRYSRQAPSDGTDAFAGWRKSFIGWWKTELDFKMYTKFGSPEPEGSIRVTSIDTLYSKLGEKGLGELHVISRQKQRYCFTAMRQDAGKTATTWCDALLWIQAKLQVVKKYEKKPSL